MCEVSVNYHEYIASKEWEAKRQERLEIDGHKCAVCGCTEGLSVHHLTYERLGHEDALNDLITACSRHHHLLDTLERFQRYSKRERKVTAINNQPFRQEAAISYGMENTQLQVNVSLPHVAAQRADCRSAQQVVESDQGREWEAEQDRRRLRGNGAA